MNIPLYIIDTFTSELFTGNTAGVCPLVEWLPEQAMMNIAAENAYSETAFFVASGGNYELRWFTPTTEVELCGHATLATAFVLNECMNSKNKEFIFHTLSGELTVSISDNIYYLNFPARKIQAMEINDNIAGCIGVKPINLVRAAKTYIAELSNEAQVASASPCFEKILDLDCNGLIITAEGREVDFVSRFFGPKVGIPEDPVTGSAHCGLVPYWYQKLGRQQMIAHQLSERGGTLYCENLNDRVVIGGNVVLYNSGEIYLP